MLSFIFRRSVAGTILALACLTGGSSAAPAQTSPESGAAAADAKKDRPAVSGAGDGRAVGGAPAGGTRGERPTFVIVESVTLGEQVETTPVYGRVVARQAGVVAARVRGAVAEIRADVGARVSRGDVLVELVSDILENERALKEAEVAEFRAKIRTAEAQLALTEQEMKRIEQLRNSAAFSAARYEDKRRDVERFRSTVAESTARLKQAEAERNMADINLTNARILAPYDGVITQRHTERGAYLNIGERVVTMTNDRWLEIEAEVPSTRLSGLVPGTRISVDPETSAGFDVIVRAIVPEENQLARTRTVRFSPSEGSRPETLAANQSVILRVPTGAPRTVLTAPKDALLQRRGSPVMFVFGDGKVQQRTVELGEAFGNRFEIVSGLNEGDQVVTRGNERLRPGQEVQIRGTGRRGGGGIRPDGEPRSRKDPTAGDGGGSSEAASGPAARPAGGGE